MKTVIGLLAFAAASLAACKEPSGPSATDERGDKELASLVVVVPETASVLIGGQVQLTAISRDTSVLRITNQPVTWSSDNPAVVTVSAAGVATGIAGGKAGIRAEVDGHHGIGVVVVRTDAGQIRVTTITTGVDLPSSYDVSVDGELAFSISANGTGMSPVVNIGAHQVRLAHSSNCRVTGENPRAVDVHTGETASVTFDITCRPFQQIAFADAWYEDIVDPEAWKYHSIVAVMNEDGSGLRTIVADVFYGDGPDFRTIAQVGREPAWSADGAHIAFNCVDGSGSSTICVVRDDGTELVRLTYGQSPTWSPDGSKIAFAGVRDGPPWLSRLYLMNADGSGIVSVTSEFAGQPAWSTDGLRIAFDCEIDPGNVDICVINPDGTGLQRLTSAPGRDAGAAWSPDGTRIAFGTQRDGTSDIAVMAADGTGFARLTNDPAPDYAPDWSPDGARIAFETLRGNWCICVMNADGTDPVRVGYGVGPVWRPAPPVP